MNPEKTIISFADHLRFEDLPGDVVDAVKRMTMNILAAMMTGSSAPAIVSLNRMVHAWGGKGQSTVFLDPVKVPATEAAFVNAAMARAMDFDDFHMQTGMHASATLIPVALAVSEAMGPVSGESLITAVALGAEISCRMRMVPDQCIGVSGWTGEIFGGFGSALTTAKLLGLSDSHLAQALGLAYGQACGNSQAIYDGSHATFLQQGIAARAGLLSILMAEAGLTGPSEFLSGRAGLYPVYYRGLPYDLDRLCNGLGERYDFVNIATKQYPSCGFTMAPIENVIGLINTHGLCADEIEGVDISVNKKMHATVCAPAQRKYHPQVPADALFSMPYVIATAVLTGDVRLEDFTPEAIGAKQRLRFMKRINIIEDEAIEKKALETNMPLGTHRIDIHCKDGRCFNRSLQFSAGFPQAPLTLDQCALKAKKNLAAAVRPLSEEKIDRLKRTVENLEALDTLSALTGLMS